jgi:hypothetical protein
MAITVGSEVDRLISISCLRYVDFMNPTAQRAYPMLSQCDTLRYIVDLETNNAIF